MAIYEFFIEHAITASSLLDSEYGDLYYGSVLGGDLYFSRLLRSEDWQNANESDKIKALYEATTLIDRLNFRGAKYSSTQKLQFPRGTDTEVPRDIEHATYEVARLLLSGLDPEEETKNQNVRQHKFGPIVTEYSEVRNIPPHVSAGIFSAKAWRLLYPYIRQNTEVTISRV